MTTDGPRGSEATTEDLGSHRAAAAGRGSGHTLLYPTVVMREPMPEPPQRRRVSARLVITVWVASLMGLVLVLVNLVTWSALTSRTDERVDQALSQEIGEFEEFAAVGTDPETGNDFTDVGELMRVHLERQYPDDQEILFGWVDEPSAVPGGGSAPGTETDSGRFRQGSEPPLDLSADPEAAAQILNSPDARGTLDTEEGPVEWEKIRVHPPDGQDGSAGWFVIGYFTAEDRETVASTMATVTLVSLFGLVFAATAAWWVAGRILQPAQQVRQAAAQITEEDLTRRIDVTGGRDDIASLAEQFNSMLDRLEGAFTEQRRFVDDAGHELRTPITIVRGHLELMGDDPEERREVVRLVTDELDRMGRIVEDLLLLAKAQQPDFLHPATVSLAELTSDIDAKIRGLGDRDWRLEAIGDATWHLDPQRITQAMVQLAANAVRHTQPGGTISIGSTVHQGSALFWITDDGPGIPHAEHGRIFQRFSRGGTPRGERGAGLGLAIVRAIAEAHHGRVDLRSAPGSGSTFTLVVPDTTQSRREHV
ncbi:HAMP domain-containing histidine kinase [Nocardiopsis sp. HNM0947]|uniref:histidine kinase n=1 Tax=Nocardiopsis coralli TaxID=2772213 RepID=A0ABR9P2Y7_9ACTN|nr:HAMP domain-containing sensor histidine kinase [Nocardiopsis coralli]MBE2998199.1 HAMP domain-containing histidine kinase [Nocardiopsis coralli]